MSLRILVIDDQIGSSEEEKGVFLRAIGELTGHAAERRRVGRYDVVFCSGQRLQGGKRHNDLSVAIEAVGASDNWAFVLLDMQFDSDDTWSTGVAGTSKDAFFGLEIEQALRARFRDLHIIRFTSKTEQEIGAGDRPYLAKLNLTPQEFRYALLAYGKLDLQQKQDLLELDPSTYIASSAMLEVYSRAMKLASTDDPVMILGETGTGKEVLAQYIHRHSGRGSSLFVPVNVAALPEQLADSELFGHERGAFTGADRQKKGYFEQVGNGTVFLDEIGDMPEEHQIRLLRVLQERQFRRVGGNVFIPFNGRVILATHRDLKQRIREGLFREDLYNRLTLNLTLPPLRERREEIIPLADRFLAEESVKRGKQGISLDGSAQSSLFEYDFPGNIRELAAIMKTVVITVGNNRLIKADDLPFSSKKTGPKTPLEDLPLSDSQSERTKELTLTELEEIIRSFRVSPLDPAMSGIKTRMEEALRDLLVGCAIQCLERCRHPVTQKLRLLPAMQLLTGNQDLKGTGAKRVMNDLLGRGQRSPVTMEELEDLCLSARRQEGKDNV